ncbi:hypothetical protein R1sor_005629 [Riccia sorocarpa]|uniref:Uncharacterized protein n=1 Tax=Riccia sorocarpa TaxID=122646 RepID=A0ABD3HKR2_9MARC
MTTTIRSSSTTTNCYYCRPINGGSLRGSNCCSNFYSTKSIPTTLAPMTILICELEPLDPAEDRRRRRMNKRKWLEDMESRREQGKKDHAVQVDESGKVIDVENGKNEWLSHLNALCLSYLDVGVVILTNQAPTELARVRSLLDAKFEYLGHPIKDDFVRKKMMMIMKIEREKLKKIWKEEGHSRHDAPCPPDVIKSQWENLIKYWTSQDGVQKAEKMKDARVAVTHLNHSGRMGYNGSASRLVNVLKPLKFNLDVILLWLFVSVFFGLFSQLSTPKMICLSEGKVDSKLDPVVQDLVENRDNLENLEKKVDMQAELLRHQQHCLAEILTLVKGISSNGVLSNRSSKIGVKQAREEDQQGSDLVDSPVKNPDTRTKNILKESEYSGKLTTSLSHGGASDTDNITCELLM